MPFIKKQFTLSTDMEQQLLTISATPIFRGSYAISMVSTRRAIIGGIMGLAILLDHSLRYSPMSRQKTGSYLVD
jgi:hypothetical protein